MQCDQKPGIRPWRVDFYDYDGFGIHGSLVFRGSSSPLRDDSRGFLD
jgi:hypothetical protein